MRRSPSGTPTAPRFQASSGLSVLCVSTTMIFVITGSLLDVVVDELRGAPGANGSDGVSTRSV